MSVSGNLETMELAELLQWVAQSGKSGTLVIDSAAVERRVFFDKGKIIATASSEPRERLGHYLIVQGHIEQAILDQALATQDSSNSLLGRILVEMGAVEEAELKKILRLKAEESLFELFLWSAGEFRFVDEQPLQGDMVPMTLEVASIVLKAAERVDEWRRISQIIPSADCVPVAVGFLDVEGLPPGAEAILDLVDDDRSISEICLETGIPEFSVNKILFRVLEAGKLKIVRPRTRTTVETRIDPEGITASTHLRLAENLVDQGDFYRALRHLTAARALDPQGHDTSSAIDRSEDRIRAVLEQEGIQLHAIPTLNLNPEAIPGLRLSPEEGFVMSRIDSSYDIASILKISPMPPLDARLVFRKLMQAGHITLEHPD